MGAMRVCSAGVPLDTAGVCQRMEQSGLGPELEENPVVTLAKVCCSVVEYGYYKARQYSFQVR